MTGTFWLMMCLGPRSYWDGWEQCGGSTGITGTLGCLWQLWYTPSRVNTGVLEVVWAYLRNRKLLLSRYWSYWDQYDQY